MELAGDDLSFFYVSFVRIVDIYIIMYFYPSLYLARADWVGVKELVAKKILPTILITGPSLFLSFLSFFFRQA